MNAKTVSRWSASAAHPERTVSVYCATVDSFYRSAAGSETDEPTVGAIARVVPTFHQSAPEIDQYTLLTRCLEDAVIR